MRRTTLSYILQGNNESTLTEVKTEKDNNYKKHKPMRGFHAF